MRTRVQRWGNSLAVRIPKSFAQEVGLHADSPVDLRLSEGMLVLDPAVVVAPTLDELLAGVTESNVHDEVTTGSPEDREAW